MVFEAADQTTYANRVVAEVTWQWLMKAFQNNGPTRCAVLLTIITKRMDRMVTKRGHAVECYSRRQSF